MLGLVVCVLRFAFASERQIFHVLPDEAGTVAMSRWFAGRAGWNMFGTSTWQPGTALLHAPVSWLIDDPIVAYRIGLLLVAVIAGVGAVLLAGLIPRLLDIGPLAAVVIAGVISLSPAGFSSTSYLWAESLVTVWFLLTVRSLMRYFDQRTLVAGLLVIAASLGGYASHSRLLAIGIVVVLLLGGDAIRRRSIGDAVAFVGFGMLGVVSIAMGSRWLFERVWDEPGSVNTMTETISHLVNPLALVDAFAGQLWYLLATSAGLFGVGVVVLVRQSQSGGIRGRDSRLVLLAVATMMGASALFHAGRTMSSFPIYGRYNDSIAMPIVAAGAVWLVHQRRRSRADGSTVMLVALAIMVGLGLLVSILHGDAIADRITPPMVAGVAAFGATDSDIDVLRLSVVIGVVGLAMLGLTRVRRRLGDLGLAALVVGLLLVGAVRMRESTSLLLNSAVRAEPVTDVLDFLEPGESVGVLFVSDESDPRPTVTSFAQQRRIFAYQFFLVGQRFEEVPGPVKNDDIRFIFAPLDDPDMLAGGAIPVWQDPVILMALWFEAP